MYYWEIKYKKLYFETHTTLKSWCEDVAGRKYWTVRDYIIAANVALTLMMNGFEKLPHNVSQCLAIARLPRDEWAGAWKKVLYTYHYHEITQDKITFLLFPPDPEKVLIENEVRLVPNVYQRVVYEAVKARVSVSDYIWNLMEEKERSIKLEIFLMSYLLFSSA